MPARKELTVVVWNDLLRKDTKEPVKGLVDVHLHILPGLDDGSQSMRDSIEMARISAESGVTAMVVTPHANQRGRFENYATPEMQRAFEAFAEELERYRIPLRLYQGMEIYASEDVVQLIRQGMLCSLAQTDYYLIEFPFACPVQPIELLLKQMLYRRYIPVIAHPERYLCVQQNPELLARWRDLGCLSQLNRGSVFFQLGPQCAKTADFLIKNELVDLFGSDAHGVNRRTPEMRSIWEYLVRHYNAAYATKLLLNNPRRLLKNTPPQR